MSIKPTLRRCDFCGKDFPAELIQRFTSTAYPHGKNIDPICGHQQILKEHGLPADTPPFENSPLARAKYLLAVDYLKKAVQ